MTHDHDPERHSVLAAGHPFFQKCSKIYDRRSPIALDRVGASEKKSKKVDVKKFLGCQDDRSNLKSDNFCYFIPDDVKF
jgi:hypothetical protein